MLWVKGGDEEKQHRLAEEVSPEERVRDGEVLEDSRVMGGFCSKSAHHAPSIRRLDNAPPKSRASVGKCSRRYA